jgi:hypothetical protein
MSLFKRFGGITIAIAGLALPGLSSAQGGPLGDEGRTWFQLYGTASSWSTTTRGNGYLQDDPGTTVSVEDELGVQRRKLAPGLSFGRRIGENWRIELDWTNSTRSGTTVLTRDIRVDGVAYPANSRLRSTVSVGGFRINGGRSFLRSDALEWGVSFGGQWISTSRTLQRASVVGGNTTLDSETSRTDTVPIPLLGLYGSWAPSPSWLLSGRADVGLTGAGYGQLAATAAWRANANFSIGLGLRHAQGRINTQAFDLIVPLRTLALDYRATGPQLLLNLVF